MIIIGFFFISESGCQKLSLYQWSPLDFQKISVVTFISDFTSLKKYQLLVISGIKYYNILSVILKSVIIFLNFISFVFISDHIILKNISFHCYQWIPCFQNISVIGYQWCNFLGLYQLCISVHWYKNGPLIKKNLCQGEGRFSKHRIIRGKSDLILV